MKRTQVIVGVLCLACFGESVHAQAEHQVLKAVSEWRPFRRSAFAWAISHLKEDFQPSSTKVGLLECQDENGGKVAFTTRNDFTVKRSIGPVGYSEGVAVHAIIATAWFLLGEQEAHLSFDSNGRTFRVTQGRLALRSGPSTRHPDVVYLSQGAQAEIFDQRDGGWRRVEIICQLYDYGLKPRPTPHQQNTVRENGWPYQENSGSQYQHRPLPQDYVVQRGDSLSEIAKAHGLTKKRLLVLNPTITNEHLIRVGQAIRLEDPIASPLLWQPTPPSYTDHFSNTPGQRRGVLGTLPLTPSQPESSGFHTVTRNETGYGIARKHRLPFSRLKALNAGVDLNVIYPGMQLRIR